MRRYSLICLPLLALSVLSGCARSPASQKGNLEVVVPDAFFGDHSTPEVAEEYSWLEDFGGEHLRRLIVEGLRANQDQKVALARLDMARSGWRAARGGRLPSLTANYNRSRQQSNFIGIAGALDEENPLRDLISTRILDNYNLDLSVLWEIDLWGRIRNATRAAIADLEAAEADLAAFRFSLAARILQAWFEAVSARGILEIERENLEIAGKLVEVAETGFARGLPNLSLDLRLSRANLEGYRLSFLVQELAVDTAVGNLEILLGRYPSLSLVVHTNLPVPRVAIPDVGVPVQLLERRPDLRSAERRLAAAVERVRHARKSLLPTISLGAGAGYNSDNHDHLLDPDFLIWNLGQNLAQPLFTGGRLVAGIDLARATQREALAAYAQSALNAFREVEVLIASERQLRKGLEAVRIAVTEAVGAHALAWDQYQRGIVDITNLLEIQRRAAEAQRTYIEVLNSCLMNRIRIHLALGGDFEVPRIMERMAERKEG